MLQNSIYLLCLATSLLCAILLARGYRASKARLLLWSSLCFAFLSINNILLVIDFVVYPDTDMAFAGVSFAVIRSITALTGLLLLIFGLVWDSK
jgi:hypothetical protein